MIGKQGGGFAEYRPGHHGALVYSPLSRKRDDPCDSFGTCEEAGVYAFGELEQQNLAPETVIFCNMNNIENLVLQAVKDTIDGDFQGCIREYGISADVAQLTEYNSHVPQEVKDKLAECMDQMRSGELDIPMITEISDDIIH